MAGPTRNINVVISANVRKYTDGLKRAQTETRKFQNTVQTANSSVGSSGQASQRAGEAHKGNAKAINGVARGFGRARAMSDNYSGAIHKGNKAMSEAQKMTGAWSKGIGFLRNALISSVAALGGFAMLHSVINGVRKAFSFMVDSVLEFDSAITESMAIANEYGPGIRKQFEEAARAQSKLSAFNPAELAEGFYQLVSAGLDTKAAIESTAIVANFAQAGVMELNKASELAAQSTAALGFASGTTEQKVAGMARVTDVLVVAALSSTATVEEFAEALTNKFGTAVALANREVEEAATILMAYAQVGIKGRMAGTQASIWMRDVQKAAIANKEAMAEMNIEVFDTNGNMNNLVDVAKSMSAAFGDMSTEGLRVKLKELGFADRAVHSILPILAAGEEAFDDFYAAAQNAGGSAAKTAERQLLSITNQMSLMKQGMSTLAEQFGRGALDAGFKAFDQIRAPLDGIYQNLQKIGKALIDAFKPAATLVGGSLLMALKGVLTVVQGLTAAIDFFSPVLSPLMTFVSTIYVMNKALAMTKGVFVLLSGALKGFTASQMQAVIATGAHTAGLSTLQIAQMAATNGNYKLAASSYWAATSSAKAWVGANGKIALSFKAAAMGAKAFGKAAWAAMKAAAPLLVIAALTAMALKIKDVHDGFKEMGQAASEGVTQSFDTESHQGMSDSIEAQREHIEGLKKAYREGAGEAGGFFGAIKTLANNVGAASAIKEMEGILEGDIEELEKYEGIVQKVANSAGVSFEVAARRIKGSGQTEALMEHAEGSKEYEDAMKLVEASLEKIPGAMVDAGLSAEQMEMMTDEAGQGMVANAEEVQKGFADAFGNLFDPAEVMSKIMEVNEAIKTGFGASASTVFGEIQQGLEEAASDAADTATNSFNSGIDNQVKNLEKAKKALDPPRGSKSTDAEKNAIDARKAAIDEEISALREGKRAKDDFHQEVGVQSLNQFLGGMKETATKSREFSDALESVRDKLRDTEMSSDMIDSVILEFASLGPEALPLIKEFAGLVGDEFTNVANSVAESIEAMNPEVTASLEDMLQQQRDVVEEMEDMRSAILAFNTAQAQLGDMGLNVDEIKQFAALGPEYAKMIPDMMARIQEAGGMASDEGTLTAMHMANSIKDQLMLSDFGTGTIPDSMALSMTAAREVMVTETAEATAAMGAKMLEGKDALVAAGGTLGTLTGEKYANDLFAAIEAKGGDELLYKLFPELQMIRAGVGQGMGSMNANNYKVVTNPDGTMSFAPHAQGGIVNTFADGGFSGGTRNPKLYKKSDGVQMFNEPETQGEAYIPLAASKRGRAGPILADVARRFGYQLTQNANGAINGPAGLQMVGGGAFGTQNAAVQIVPVPVPIESKSETNFNGPIQGVKMEDAMAFAERKKRQKRLAGGKR